MKSKLVFTSIPLEFKLCQSHDVVKEITVTNDDFCEKR